MQRIFGYCRISTKKQNIDRQVRNILAAYPTAIIVKETYTGTRICRKGLDYIVKESKSGDTIVFDSVSRMSRNAADGVALYMQLFEKGVELVFLKEPTINTANYRQALSHGIELVGNNIADIFINATNEALRLLATRQVEIAFEQAEKEVTDTHQRIKEGIETARRNNKRIGTPKNAVLNVKKKAPAIKFIKKNSVRFGGNLNDTQCAAAAKICRKTFYKYLEEIEQETGKENEND